LIEKKIDNIVFQSKMGGCCTPNKRVKVTTAVASVRKKLAIASLPDEKCIFFRLYMDVSKHKAPRHRATPIDPLSAGMAGMDR
jgi:hypothetical protein